MANDRTSTWILFWTAFTGSFLWLITIRSAVEPHYVWGLAGLRGPGITGDYWIVALLLGVVLWGLYEGFRGPRRPAFFLLPVWHIGIAAAATVGVVRMGSDARFRGDSWGIDIPLWIFLLPLLAFAALAVAWALQRQADDTPRWGASWTLRQRRALLIFVGLFVGDVVFFRAGPLHGWGDKLGVVCAIVQWLVLIYGFFAPSKRAEGHGAEVAGVG